MPTQPKHPRSLEDEYVPPTPLTRSPEAMAAAGRTIDRRLPNLSPKERELVEAHLWAVP